MANTLKPANVGMELPLARKAARESGRLTGRALLSPGRGEGYWVGDGAMCETSE
jgi:hypothetical protein